jgi:hypothetical protein
MTVGRRVGVLVAAAACVGLLTGCTGPPEPGPGVPPEPTPSASSSAAPEPALTPDGTAADNLPLFSAVIAEVWSSEERAAGRAYVDALTAVGFDKSAMQVTRDTSTVGNPAESIQFSVRWGEECLVGQVGPTIGDPVAVVTPVLAEGACLVGQTRPIDW